MTENYEYTVGVSKIDHRVFYMINLFGEPVFLDENYKESPCYSILLSKFEYKPCLKR